MATAMATVIMRRPSIERKLMLALPQLYLLSFLTLSLLLLLPPATATRAKATGKSSNGTNKTQLLADLKELDPCVLSSIASFIQPRSLVPTNPDELKAFCQTHLEGYKCVREKSKAAPALVRRGLVSLVTGMSRMTKKYCAEPESQVSRKFVADLKCVVDKHAQQYRETEIEFGNSFYEIQRQNHKDSVQELKYICCSIYKYRRSFLEEAPGCPASRATLEEIITNIVANNVVILCDDEHHILTDVCPKLTPLKVAKTQDPKGKELSPSVLALFLIATLGE